MIAWDRPMRLGHALGVGADAVVARTARPTVPEYARDALRRSSEDTPAGLRRGKSSSAWARKQIVKRKFSGK